MTEQVLGPFRLTVARASGRDGDVYDAWDTRVNRALDLVSLPRLSRRASDGALLYRSFFEEVEQHTLLRHPNLRTAIEHSARDSMDAWYVMEPTQGATLRQLLGTVKRLPWLQGVCIMHELAVALAFAHGRGVVHAHLRPSEVILQRRGRVVLSGFDFGLKTFIRTNVAAFEGLVDVMEDEVYVAPETLRLSDPGPRSDLFSLGVLSFEMFTGRVPFDNADAIRHYARSRRSATPDPWDDASHLPEPLRDLLMELIAPTMDGRPLSVAEVQLRLKEMLELESVKDVHSTLRSTFSRQAAVFPRTDVDDEERTAIIPAATDGATRRHPTSRRGPIRRSTVPGLGQSDDDPKASRRRKTVRERGSKKTTAKGVVPTGGPDSSFEGGAGPTDAFLPASDGNRRPTDRYESTSDEASRKPIRRSVALQILADEGYLSTPEKRSGNLTKQLAIGGLILLALFGVFYLVVLQNPGNTKIVSTEAARRATSSLEPVEPESGDDYAAGAGGSFRRATSQTKSEAETQVQARVDKVSYQLRQENYAAAERIAALGLADAPGSVELAQLRGTALFKLGRVQDALAAFTAADRLRGRRAVEARTMGALLLEEAGQLKPALATFQQLREIGEDPRLLAGVGRVLAKLERYDDALKVLRLAVVEPDATSATLTLLADLELAKGSRVDALRYFSLALQADPSNKQAAAGVARLEGRPATAGGTDDPGGASALELATAIDLERAGDTAFKRRSYKIAAALFTKALANSEEKKPRLVKNLALALQASGQRRDAIKAWAALVSLTPRDADAHFQWGRLLLQEGKGSGAKKAFSNAVRVDPTRWEPHFELGRLALAAEKYDEAVARFSGVLRLRPRDAAATQNLGKALTEAGQPARAATAFQRLAQLRPSDPAPLLTAAALFKMAKRPADAAAALSEACRRGAKQACAP